MASAEEYSSKKLKLDQQVEILEPGFIVIDLQIDGNISRTKEFGIPQILQIAFAPLEELAHPYWTFSFYIQPIDPNGFDINLETKSFIQNYSDDTYAINAKGKGDSKVNSIPLKEGLKKLVLWKRQYYQDRPVYLIAHNVLKNNKIVLEHHLRQMNLFNSFNSHMNSAGWIDSLEYIRGMPNILKVLGYLNMSENCMMWSIWQEWLFSLNKLVEALTTRYDELLKTGSPLQWPIFQLSDLNGDEDGKWLHHFSRDDMIHVHRDLVKQLTLHGTHYQVMALVCILQQLNLYPRFRKDHFLDKVCTTSSKESEYTKEFKLQKEIKSYKPAEDFEPGFIVMDLETDGLIKRSKKVKHIPQILQIGFAPLEELAQPSNTVGYYTQPKDPEAFHKNLEGMPFLQKFYRRYSESKCSYFIKREGKEDCKINAIPLEEAINEFMLWKRQLYKDRPVYLIAHNARKFDKIVFEHQLEQQNLLSTFKLRINLKGWIDSVSIIRGMENNLKVLGHPYATEKGRMNYIWREKPFSLSKLVEALSKRYEELARTRTTLQWPIFDLSLLHRNEEEQKWLHHFSRDVMIHQGRDLMKQLTFHQAGDDVTALVCILHQLNLYPTFRKAHFQRNDDIIIL